MSCLRPEQSCRGTLLWFLRSALRRRADPHSSCSGNSPHSSCTGNRRARGRDFLVPGAGSGHLGQPRRRQSRVLAREIVWVELLRAGRGISPWKNFSRRCFTGSGWLDLCELAVFAESCPRYAAAVPSFCEGTCISGSSATGSSRTARHATHPNRWAAHAGGECPAELE